MKLMLRKIMAAFCLTVAMIATAEAQNSFAYQAVIRTAQGELVSNQKVGMKFSLIHDGKVVYSETHAPETNQYGNVQVEVGKGQKVSGSFAEVPWSTMQVMMKIEADPNGGTNYIDLGTIQLQPAPYAMYATAAGKVSTVQAGDPKSDSDALFEVKDKDGNVVFAVYPDGVRVFVNDEDTAGKVMPTGFAVSGRKAAKEGEESNIFAVNAAGTQVFVGEGDTTGSKVMPTGFAVSGRKAAKDGSDLFTVGSTGTQVYIDEDATKAISTGFAVSGRKAAKGEEKYLEINADGTHVYVDDADSDKPIQTGFAVSGRRAAKEDSNNKMLEINAEGTKIYVGSDGKVVPTGFAVSGRKAAKGKEIKLFEVNSFGTKIYIDAQKDKAMQTGFAVSGRKAAKDGTPDKYMVIDADGTVIYVNYEEAKAMQTGFAVSGRKAAKDGTQNTILKVDNTEGTRVYIEDVDGKVMPTGFAVSGRKAAKEGETDLMRVTGDNTTITAKNLDMLNKESEKNMMSITSNNTQIYTDELQLLNTDDDAALSTGSGNVEVMNDLVVMGDVAQTVDADTVENASPIRMLVQKIDTIAIADSAPALKADKGYALLKIYGKGKFTVNESQDPEKNDVMLFSAAGNLTTFQSEAVVAVIMTKAATKDAKLIIWPLKAVANDYKINFGLMAAGDTANRYVNVEAFINVTAPVECLVDVQSTNESIGTVAVVGPKVYGEKVDIVATPIEGYHFTNWSDGRRANPRTALILHDTAFASANFEINTYKLNTTAENGKIEISVEPNADTTFNHGTEIELTAMADEHYHFMGWTDGEAAAKREFKIKSDTAFEATFAIDSFKIATLAENGEVIGAGTYAYGTEIELVATPDTLNGFHFVNWSDGNTDNPRKLTVTQDSTFTANFTKNTYALTYIVDGKIDGEIKMVEYEAELTLRKDSVKTGYTFSGWTYNGKNEKPKTMPMGNLTVAGSFTINNHTITYKVDDEVYQTFEKVDYDSVITIIDNPKDKTGYTFSGWSYNGSTELPKNMPDADVEISGTFEVNRHTITYKVDGTVYQTIEDVAYDTQITAIDGPAKEGYDFRGWSNVPSKMPDADVEINGTFSKKTFQIKFDVNGVITEKTYQYDETPSYDDINLTKESTAEFTYTFEKWNPEITQVTAAQTYTALFTEKRVEYTLKFMDGEDIVETRTVANNSSISAPATNPTKAGYAFAGWAKTANATATEAVAATMPTNDLTYYAVWFNAQLSCSATTFWNGSTLSVGAEFKTNQGTTCELDEGNLGWQLSLKPINGTTTLVSANAATLTIPIDAELTHDLQYILHAELKYEGTQIGEVDFVVTASMITILPAGTDGSAGTTATYVLFGEWPQTIKADGVSVDENDSKAMGYFTYFKGSDGSWYVKATENAYGTGDAYKYSNGTEVAPSSANSIKYYKVEPIKWRVVMVNYNGTGNALLVADCILTSIQYFPYNNGHSNSVSGNNYKYSTVRAYLNGSYESDYDRAKDYDGKGFLQSAFSTYLQSQIVTTEVDNTPASTGIESNQFACANTNDKLFLLSATEVNSIFDSNTRKRKSTDYAKANYVRHDGNSAFWWLRSPNNNPDYSQRVRTVYPSGNINVNACSDNYLGVVPALTIPLRNQNNNAEPTTCIFVGGNNANDTNTGLTANSPLATMEEALGRMNNKTVNYTIYINGTLTGSTVIDENYNNMANSITLRGLNTTDKLDGQNQSRVLKVSTTVPVTIKNLNITRGMANGDNGGGIYIASGATLTLADGALVSGNSSTRNGTEPETGCGGGVYNAGTLFMYGSAVIGDNTKTIAASSATNCSNTAGRGAGLFNQNDAKAYLGYSSESQIAELTGGIFYNFNESEGGYVEGAGVFNRGTLKMNSGNIAYNGTATSGVGVYSEGDGYFELSGGKISNNKSTGLSTWSGGGVRSMAVFVMTGGEISNNETKAAGSGVFIQSTFTMTGGVIKDNKPQDGVYFYNDATFSMGGSAVICDTVNYNKEITICQPFDASVNLAAAIRPSTYTQNRPILVLDNDLTTTKLVNEVGKFRLLQNNSGATWYISTDGKIFDGFVQVDGAYFDGSGVSGSYIFVENRKLNIPDLFVSDHEVTQREYEATMGKSSNHSVFNGSTGYEPASGEIQENRPVENVSWYDALVYCNKRSIAEDLTPCYTINNNTNPDSWGTNYSVWNGVECNFEADGYRLPTEAEWEYLAMEGNHTNNGQTLYSGSGNADEVAWYNEKQGSNNKTHEVRRLKPNSLGIYDMSGNVWEWCWDYRADITTETPATGPTSGDQNHHCERGGWFGEASAYCYVNNRQSNAPDYKDNHGGFRVVRTITRYATVGGVACADLSSTRTAINDAEGITDVVLYHGVTRDDLGKASTENSIINAICNNNNARFNLVVAQNANIELAGEEDCAGMFNGCSSLFTLDLRGLNTDGVTNMSTMFINCYALTSIDVSGFNTKSVTNMSGMFTDCKALTKLDLRGFNTESVTDMGYMFKGCETLSTLDLSSFNTSNVSVMNSMFAFCSELRTIYAAIGADWYRESGLTSEYMFYNCSKLKGGSTTECDGTNNIEASYAVIDGLNGKHGYFTEKSISYYINPDMDDYTGHTGLTAGQALPTMEDALAKMDDDQTHYTLYIDGTLTGPQKVGGVIYPNSTNNYLAPLYTNAGSLTLCGANGLDDENQPLDMIDAGCDANNQGSALTILYASFPITIKNLKITGGYCTNGGGISFSDMSNKSTTLTLAEGAVITENTATDLGGGIYLSYDNTLLNIQGGSIIGNSAQSGGGVFYNDGKGFKMDAGTISGNVASEYGGGVYSSRTALAMTGGTISENTAQYGGAVFIPDGSNVIKMSGSAKIPFGVNGVEEVGKNDVYFQYNSSRKKDKGICVDGELYGSDIVATITAGGWQRGMSVLKAGSNLDGDLTDEIISRFAVTNPDFTISIQTDDATTALINAPIYVASADATKRKSCTGAPNAVNTKLLGTKSDPLASMSQAVSKIDSIYRYVDSYIEHTILVDGEITGNNAQFSFSTSGTSLLIKGANGDNTNDVLNAQGASGSVITMSSGSKVEIQDLTITGGTAEKGGGIIVADVASLRLARGALVTGNQATSGGGVYLIRGGKLFMYSTAQIGEKGAGFASSNSKSNSATTGGGVYNENGSLFLGYTDENTVATGENKFIGGIYHNYATEGSAGGVYNSSTFKMCNGDIAYNGAKGYGAGVFTNAAEGSSSSFEMLGGAISNNKCYTNSTSESQYGGGVRVNGNATFEMTDGEISGNTDANNGGGVSIAENGTFTMKGGIIKNNTIKAGGIGSGVLYESGTFNMEGGAKISANNDVYLPSGKSITILAALTSDTVAVVTPQVYSMEPEVQIIDSIPNVSTTSKECGRFFVTPQSGGTYTEWWVKARGVLTAHERRINVANDADHPYVITSDHGFKIGDDYLGSQQVFITADVFDVTENRDYYITFDNFEHYAPKPGWGCIGFHNFNPGTTFTYHITLEGENISQGNKSSGMGISGSAGTVKLVFDATTSGSFTLYDTQHIETSFGKGAGVVEYALAEGCSFSGTIDGVNGEFTNIQSFFETASQSTSTCRFTITRNQ